MTNDERVKLERVVIILDEAIKSLPDRRSHIEQVLLEAEYSGDKIEEARDVLENLLNTNIEN